LDCERTGDGLSTLQGWLDITNWSLEMIPDHTGVTFSTNEITSAYSLDRDAMTGWFLHPQTPLDGCINRPSLLEPETKQSWWSIQEDKEKTEDEIRRRMNLQTTYEDCQYKEANKFET